MNDKKVETFTYKDLGFPVQIIDVPMKKVQGEWTLDINLNMLQLEVLKQLIHRPSPLKAEELRFIRKYFERKRAVPALGITAIVF